MVNGGKMMLGEAKERNEFKVSSGYLSIESTLG